jgi:hypothetical protein
MALAVNVTCPQCGLKCRPHQSTPGQDTRCPSCLIFFPNGLQPVASLLARAPQKEPALEIQVAPPNRTILAHPEPLIRYTCPRCKKALEAPVSLAGDKLSCPSCAQRLQIPQPSAPPPPAVNKTMLAVGVKPAAPPPAALPVMLCACGEIVAISANAEARCPACLRLLTLATGLDTGDQDDDLPDTRKRQGGRRKASRRDEDVEETADDPQEMPRPLHRAKLTVGVVAGLLILAVVIVVAIASPKGGGSLDGGGSLNGGGSLDEGPATVVTFNEALALARNPATSDIHWKGKVIEMTVLGAFDKDSKGRYYLGVGYYRMAPESVPLRPVNLPTVYCYAAEDQVRAFADPSHGGLFTIRGRVAGFFIDGNTIPPGYLVVENCKLVSTVKPAK